MSQDTKNFLAFLVGLFIAVALLLPGSVWATTVIPDVPGYTSTSAGYTPSAGTLKGWQGTYNTAAKSYPVAGKITLMSKAIPVAGSAKLLDTAGDLAKAGMRLNPWAIAGTLAAGWLIDQGLQYLDGEWQKADFSREFPNGYLWRHSYSSSGTYPVGIPCGTISITQTQECDVMTAATYGHNAASTKTIASVELYSDTGTTRQYRFTRTDQSTLIIGVSQTTIIAIPSTQPATDSDWAGLPDPTPTVGAELPSAAYMPAGAPVSAPTYDFAPVSVPVGSPYSKPDGSTHQDGVTLTPVINNITNNYNSVKVVNYSTKITNADGSPVAVPVKEEKPDEQQDQCEKYPESIGCAKLGEFEHEIPKKEFVFEFEPEAVNMPGQCPPDIQVLGSALSFAPACGAMSTIKPIVVGGAALIAAMILFGGMRGAD